MASCKNYFLCTLNPHTSSNERITVFLKSCRVVQSHLQRGLLLLTPYRHDSVAVPLSATQSLHQTVTKSLALKAVDNWIDCRIKCGEGDSDFMIQRVNLFFSWNRISQKVYHYRRNPTNNVNDADG